MYGNDIISINEIIRIVKKHKKLILTIPTIFCSITIFYLSSLLSQFMCQTLQLFQLTVKVQ